jgi:nuclear pore complex protein Nup155
LEVEKRRPVDVLAHVLEERSAAKLEQFFRIYGAAEAAAMCFMLATSPSSAASPVSLALVYITIMLKLSVCFCGHGIVCDL